MTVDLRSDTVTKPTAAMRAVMAAADVGDDVYGEDPTINDLEVFVADLFGHEAGLFVPSGTMGNQLAIRTLVEPGTELLVDDDAHIVIYEMGAAAAISGLSTRTFPSSGGVPDPARLLAMVRTPAPYSITTAAVALEQTHNVSGGGVIPLEVIREIRTGLKERGVALHCDGARIWNAMTALGVSARELGEHFDTMSVCLSKGLGAPVGSVVVGSAERMASARLMRKRMGGGMRQAGILAAAGRHAIEHHLPLLADDHRRAQELAEAIGAPRPDSNMVRLEVSDMAGVIAQAGQAGVRIGSGGAGVIRMVTHIDLTDDDIQVAIKVLQPLIHP